MQKVKVVYKIQKPCGHRRGGGGLPSLALFSKIVQEGGGAQKCPKKLSTWYMDAP